MTDLLAEVDTEATVLPTAQRAALEAALERGEASGGGDRLAPSLALRSIITALSGSRPLVIAVDDLQWLDRSTARALSFAFRRARGGCLRLLAAARTGQTAETLVLPAAFEPDRISVELVTRLRLPQIGRLLRERAGASLPPPALARVTALSAGNPLHALELVQAHGADGSAGHPYRLDNLLEDRIAALKPAARRVAAAAAMLGRPTVELLEAVGPGSDDALDAAVLEVTSGRVRFTHPFLAAAATGSLGSRRVVTDRLRACARG